MTALVLYPLAVALVLAGGAITWPLARRAGRRSATRDRDDIERIRAGFDDGQDLPRQYGTLAENRRRAALLAGRYRTPLELAMTNYQPRHSREAEEFAAITQSLAELALPAGVELSAIGGRR